MKTMISILMLTLSVPALSCNVRSVGKSCTAHMGCGEIEKFKYQGDTCFIDSWSEASCSGTALFIKLKSKNDGEDCKITVLGESE